MANKSPIEWTNASWNPATGCDEVSPGCKRCYAKKLSKRLKVMGVKKYRNDFAYTEHINELEIPLHWKKPRKIFVNSMSDLFHENATGGFLNLVFETMLKANWHTYQILTKRPERMMQFIVSWLAQKQLEKVPTHIWIGVSVEMHIYNYRIDILRSIPASVRIVSFEPLLEEVFPNLVGIHQAIVGGESGAGHRTMAKVWVYTIKEACKQSDTEFFFKQWGGRTSKSGGRLLDGKTYETLVLIRTGSKDHNIRLTTLAQGKGWKLKASGAGLVRVEGEGKNENIIEYIDTTEDGILQKLLGRVPKPTSCRRMIARIGKK